MAVRKARVVDTDSQRWPERVVGMNVKLRVCRGGGGEGGREQQFKNGCRGS